jgi:hypothetical protein
MQSIAILRARASDLEAEAHHMERLLNAQPLMPAMRPVNTIRSTDANPISAPPIKADMGSKGAIIGPLGTSGAKCSSPEKNDTAHAKRSGAS